MELNKDIETRDKIIFGRYRTKKYAHDDIVHFGGLESDKLGKLITQGFIDSDYKYTKDSPKVSEIHQFLLKYPSYNCYGYATSSGIYITGVVKGHACNNPDEFKEFMKLFRNFSKFDVSTMNCLFEKEVRNA